VAPIHVDEHTIEVAGAPVFFHRAPATGAPALCLHSVPTSSDDWRELLGATGGVAPDLPGFGRSGKAGNLDYSLDGYADFVQRFLDLLELERVRVVGHGWGAAIGLVFAQRHPERVERLALIDAIPLLAPFTWPRIVAPWRRPVLGELVMGSVNRRLLGRTLRAGSTTPEAWPDAKVKAVWEQFDQGTQRAILKLHRSVDAPGLARAGAGLGELTQPALVIWGERDPWLAPSLADAYAARLPNATLIRVPDAGHWPWLDQPALLDQLQAFVTGPERS
jgi:pimeloyl-ACP methyl ester carboxylesterase